MGNILTHIVGSTCTKIRNLYNMRWLHHVRRGGNLPKQPREPNDDDNVQPAKRRKTMSHYIYHELYEKGVNSDITIVSMGKRWNLHKSVLQQSSYFAAMFSGSWKESTQDLVEIHFVGPYINLKAIEVVFSSFYCCDAVIEISDVLSVLSAASFLQMHEIVKTCEDLMIHSVNVKTVLLYLDVSDQFNLEDAKTEFFKWLCVNLMTYVSAQLKVLAEISVDLMAELVGSITLVVIQNEFSVYMMLRLWLFLKTTDEWETMSYEEAFLASEQYFTNRTDEREFLLTEEGAPYSAPFKAMRLWYLADIPISFHHLQVDQVLPTSWLNPPQKSDYDIALLMNQRANIGSGVTHKQFNTTCQRFGIVLYTDAEHSWRWSGFNFGLNLEWICNGKTMSVRRLRRFPCYASIGSHRYFNVRVTLFSVDAYQQVKSAQSTSVLTVYLDEDEQVLLLNIRPDMEFPLVISVNFLSL